MAVRRSSGFARLGECWSLAWLSVVIFECRSVLE